MLNIADNIKISFDSRIRRMRSMPEILLYISPCPNINNDNNDNLALMQELAYLADYKDKTLY